MASRTLQVVITGDASSVKKALSDVEGSTESLSNKFNSVGQKLFRAGARMSAGISLPVIGLAKVAFDELNQSEAVAAQTNAVIKSTGGVANVTAKHIDSLGTSLLNLSGTDDEVVKQGANILLTFKNIRNEAGAGNKIFDQATKLTLDLSKAFGKDMKSSAILVGKALNDPIGGLTALQRVGVQFTQSQKDQIKALVDSGNVMGAQKIILAELQSQVGGSAKAYGKTFAGQIDIAKESLKNSGAEIIKSVLPTLKDLALVVADVVKWFSTLSPTWKGVILGAVAAAAAIGPLVTVFGALATAVGVLLSPVALVIAALVAIGVAAYLLWTNWNTVWNYIVNHPAIAIVVSILAAPVAAFVLIIGALKFLYENWDTIWSAIQQIAGIAWSYLSPIFNAIVSALQFIWAVAQTLWNIWQAVWSGISSATSGAWGVLSGVFGVITGALGAVWGAVQFLGGIWSGVMGALGGIAAGAAGAVEGALSGIIGILSSIVGMAQTAANALSDLSSFVTGSSGSIGDVPPAQRAILRQLGYGAEGAIVSRPTLALIGEAGPEAVVPLNRMSGASPLPGSGAGINIVVNAGFGADGPGIADTIVGVLARHQQGGGNVPWPKR